MENFKHSLTVESKSKVFLRNSLIYLFKWCKIENINTFVRNSGGY